MPTQQQIANAANPTPVNINLPGQGQVFRSNNPDDYTVYQYQNGALNQLNLGDLGKQTYGQNIDSLGGAYNYRNGVQQAGIKALQEKYGIDYNSIGQGNYNLSDILQQVGNNRGQIDPTQLKALMGAPQGQSTSMTLNGPGSGAVATQGNYSTPTTPYGAQSVNQGAGAQFQTASGTSGGSPINAGQSQAPQYGQTQSSQSSQSNVGNPLGNFSNGNTSGLTPTGTADQYLQNYLSTLAPSSQESALQGQLNNISSQQANISASRDLGIQGVNEQPIATPFLTGQASAITNRAAVQQGALSAQAQPLQAQLALQQAKRQSAMDISKAMLEYQQKQQELAKPVFGGYGTTGYALNPKTGKYEPLAGGSSSANDDALLGDAQARGLLDASQITKYGRQAIIDTLKQNPNFDFKNSKQDLLNSTSYTKDAFGNIVPVQRFPGSSGGSGSGSGSSSGGYKAGQLTALLQSQGKSADEATLQALWSQYGNGGSYSNDVTHNSQIYSALGGSSSSGGSSGGTKFPAADAASLKQQQQYADSTQRAFNTANQNLQALIPFMQQAGVNSASNVPLINSLQSRVKAGLTDAGTIAAYRAALAGLRAEYAQVLSRGGEVTEGQRAQAASLIPEDLTPVQLQQVADRLNIEGTNAVKEANAQIQTIKDRVNGTSTSSSSSGTSGSSSNPLGI